MTDIETVERFRPELDAKLQQEAMAKAEAELARRLDADVWRLHEAELNAGVHE